MGAVLVGLVLALLVVVARWTGRRRAAASSVEPAAPDVAVPARLADPSGRPGRGGDGIVR